MRVFMSVDIEGISGLVSWSQCGGPNGTTYDWAFARRRMTADTNAAIRGARAGGANEIVLRDSHGSSKNLLFDDLEPGVRLVSGHGSLTDGMMIGIDDRFDAAMLIGYHAMAGTWGGIMEHTISNRVHRMSINGMGAGEIALSTGTAGAYGVPVVCVTSDAAGCGEAEALIPGVTTACVKEGFGRYSGRLVDPDEAIARIEAAAQLGCERRTLVAPWQPTFPATLRLEFHHTEEADMSARLWGVKRVDGYTLEATGGSWAELHQMAWAMILHARLGAFAHD